jgi:hypothetical protein
VSRYKRLLPEVFSHTAELQTREQLDEVLRLFLQGSRVSFAVTADVPSIEATVWFSKNGLAKLTAAKSPVLAGITVYYLLALEKPPPGMTTLAE